MLPIYIIQYKVNKTTNKNLRVYYKNVILLDWLTLLFPLNMVKKEHNELNITNTDHAFIDLKFYSMPLIWFRLRFFYVQNEFGLDNILILY